MSEQVEQLAEQLSELNVKAVVEASDLTVAKLAFAASAWGHIASEIMRHRAEVAARTQEPQR